MTWSRPRIVAARLIPALWVVAACGSDGGMEPDPPPVPSAITFAGTVQPIFTNSCAFNECHAGPEPHQDLNLSAGQAYANIVNVPSVEVPRLFRIAPNNPDSSFLVLKLEGKAGLVGGVGTRMPLGGSLRQGQIDSVRAWVAAGALNN